MRAHRLKTLTVNVDGRERLLSIVGGAILGLYGLMRLPLTAVAALLGGGYLFYRGVTGHCYAYEALDINTAVSALPSRTRRAPQVPPSVRGDVVAEASWESFPASDPPAWT